MKKIIFITIIALLAVGLFVAGWRFGLHQQNIRRDYAIPLIDERLARAASKALVLHLMDLGNYSDARAIIQGQFNNEILEVALDGDLVARGPESIHKTCAMIISFRNAYPSNYLCRPDHGDAWTVDTVNSFLKQASMSSK